MDFDFGLVHSYFKGLILTITSITTFTSSFNACFFKCTLRTTLAARNHLIAIKEGFKQTSLLVHGANANHCIDQRNNVERNTDGIHSFNQLFTTRTHCTSDGISLLFHERPQQLVVDVLQTLLYDITVFQFQHGTHIADNTPGRQVHILVCIRLTQLHVKITAELINNTCAGQFLVLVVGRKLVVDDNCVFAQLGISNMVVQNQYGCSQVFQLFMVDIIITGRVGQDDKTIALTILSQRLDVVLQTMLLAFMQNIINLTVGHQVLQITVHNSSGGKAIIIGVDNNQNSLVQCQYSHKEVSSSLYILQISRRLQKPGIRFIIIGGVFNAAASQK